MARDLLIVLGAFAIGTGVAEALGASNLGTGLAFGQIAFAVTLVWVLLMGGRASAGITPEG